MFSGKLFQITFTVSLAVHAVIFFQNPNLDLLGKISNKPEKIEISYVKIKEAQQPKLKPLPKLASPRKEGFVKLPAKVTFSQKTPPPFGSIENVFIKGENAPLQETVINKPVFIRQDAVAVKRKITLPPLDSANKINNQVYIGYYQMVREKIRRAAYQNYARTETGEVYLSFVISQDGSLKETRLAEEKSSPVPYLRETALRSIKDASPFPTFPKELDYPQLSFNIVISFEIEQ